MDDEEVVKIICKYWRHFSMRQLNASLLFRISAAAAVVSVGNILACTVAAELVRRMAF